MIVYTEEELRKKSDVIRAALCRIQVNHMVCRGAKKNKREKKQCCKLNMHKKKMYIEDVCVFNDLILEFVYFIQFVLLFKQVYLTMFVNKQIFKLIQVNHSLQGIIL